jgi:hypothetical protein
MRVNERMNVQAYLKRFSNRLEITFWGAIIPLLPMFQSLIQWLYAVKGTDRWDHLGKLALLLSGLGLLAGFLAGLVSAL